MALYRVINKDTRKKISTWFSDYEIARKHAIKLTRKFMKKKFPYAKYYPALMDGPYRVKKIT